jgi:peptidoglycan/LPS O-acetylase OafA/YrhL
LTFAVVFAGVLVVWLWPWGNQFSTFAWQSILVGFVSSLTTWCWVIALLGLGRRYLDSPGKVLDYAREAAYPFYILHLPINTIVGYFVVQWNTGIAVKYLFVNIITTAVTIAVYDVLVKWTNVTRFLFGMRLKKATRKLASIEKSQTPSRF